MAYSSLDKTAGHAADVIRDCVSGKRKDPAALLAALNFFLSKDGGPYMSLLSDVALANTKLRLRKVRSRLISRIRERGIRI